LYLETNNNNKNQKHFSATHSHLTHCRIHKMCRLFHRKNQYFSWAFAEFQIIRWWWM